MTKTIKYEYGLVTYIDILGFGELIRSEKNPKKINEIYETLQKEAKFDVETEKMFSQKFVNFSDCCVRTTPFIAKDGKLNKFGILFTEILQIVFIQVSLIHHHNILLRGALTIDKIYHEKNKIFGPALVRAYKLERDLAVFPRIILDSTIFEIYNSTPLLKAWHHNHEEDKDYLRSYIRKGDDGIWFVDYLSGIEKQFDCEIDYIDFLQHHKKTIIDNVQKSKKNEKIIVKYNWLMNYHNSVVMKYDSAYYEQLGVNIEKIMINAKEMPMNYEL
ncbi:MAG: hypothetical protein KAI43_14070 [Candidatus Aureabacteria bacterium]|nr:hypothetical protein [Candidatus Auribacterota bacterium]